MLPSNPAVALPALSIGATARPARRPNVVKPSCSGFFTCAIAATCAGEIRDGARYAVARARSISSCG